jgi:hypothetical protein
MVADGLSHTCAQSLIDASTAPATTRRYASIQREFTSWMRTESRDPDKFDVPSIVEFLFQGWTRSDWRPQTINTNKCAILAMYQEENDLFNSHPYAKHLITLVKRKDLKAIKNTPVDISPILTLFRAWGSNDSLPIDNLVCKLAWLLGVCGFLRPDDVRCINVARSTINAAGILSLQVVAPKEKVDGSSTVVKVLISPASDPLICPVQAYSAYLTRLPADLTTLAHHKSTRTTPRPDTVPLLRHQDDPSQALASSTIGAKMNSITDHMTFPPDTIRPSCRAIGSTLAAFHDVSVDEVKKHGRWSPLSATFEKFYRLNRNSAINFSSIVLAGSGSTASVSGRHNGE